MIGRVRAGFWIAGLASCSFHGQSVLIDDAGGPPFDPTTCPTNYVVVPTLTSRYRLIIDGHPGWTQSDTCAADVPGATHLAVLGDLPETMAIQHLVDTFALGIAGSATYIGGIQVQNQHTPETGWLSITGGTMFAAWATGEPNDADGTENGQEQFVALAIGRAYHVDYAGTSALGAVCECDGRRVSAEAAALIDAYRQ